MRVIYWNAEDDRERIIGEAKKKEEAVSVVLAELKKSGLFEKLNETGEKWGIRVRREEHFKAIVVVGREFLAVDDHAQA